MLLGGGKGCEGRKSQQQLTELAPPHYHPLPICSCAMAGIGCHTSPYDPCNPGLGGEEGGVGWGMDSGRAVCPETDLRELPLLYRCAAIPWQTFGSIRAYMIQAALASAGKGEGEEAQGGGIVFTASLPWLMLGLRSRTQTQTQTKRWNPSCGQSTPERWIMPVPARACPGLGAR